MPAARSRRRTVDEGSLQVIDLRALDSTRLRIKGSAYWVADGHRSRYGSSEYLLIREPDNQYDRNAVAVYGRGRKVGHISAAKAAAIGPLLDTLDADAFRVAGAGPSGGSIQMWVDLPRVTALRAFAVQR